MKVLTIGGATQDIYLMPTKLETITLHDIHYLALAVDTKIAHWAQNRGLKRNRYKSG